MATKIGLYQAVSRNIGDLLIDSVPTAVTATTIDCTKLIHQQYDAFLGKEIYIYAGAGAGQSRTVGSYVPASRRLVFAETFGSVPSTNSNFLVFNYFQKIDYDYAFDTMFGNAKLKNLQERTGTLQLVASQYEYAVPSGFEYISTLRLVPSGSSDYGSDDEVSLQFELRPHLWRIEANPLGSFCIIFDRRKINLNDWDNEWVRVMGQVKPDVGATDNATIPADLEEYIKAGMSMLLTSRRMDETTEWKAKFYMFRDMVSGRGNSPGIEEYVFRQPRGKRCT